MAHGYTLDNAWVQARERLGRIEAHFDPGSIRHLERLGVAEGWHCLEVAGGGGSIATWLSQKVGTTGRVVATDIDARFLDGLDYPNVEVRRHDIVNEALPEAAFDLVHGRFILMHLAERDRALQSMVGALKPGGWLLVEEEDAASWLPDPRMSDATLFAKGTSALNKVQTDAGVDLHCGRQLYSDVRAVGLVDVDGEGRVPVLHAGSPGAPMWQLTIAQRRDKIVGEGLLTDEEMNRLLALFDDPGFAAMDFIAMAVWGRKPE